MANKNGRKFPDPPKTESKGKKADSLRISRATNGFTLNCSYPMTRAKASEPMAYDSDSNKDTVFESKESLLAHLATVL